MINIPKSWANITVTQFKEIFIYKKDEFETIEDYYSQILSVVTDLSIDEIDGIDHSQFIEYIENIDFIYKMPNKIPKPYIETKAGKLYLKDNFNELTIGEFIDIENLLTQNYIQNINLLLSIFYRQKTDNSSLLFLDAFEKYGNWIYHRAPLFNNVSILDVYGVINKYLIFRKDFFERYAGLFDDSVVDEEDIDETDSISKSEKMKDEEKQKNIKKWSWDLLIYKLSKNDPIKFEEATTMSVIQAFNIFSMKKELGLE